MDGANLRNLFYNLGLARFIELKKNAGPNSTKIVPAI